MPGRTVLSAGSYPEPGRRSPADAVQSARRLGIDLGGHRSRVVDTSMVEQADAIFVFDWRNLAAVLRRHPAAASRIHLIGALVPDGPLVVADPFGGTAANFDEAYRQIARALGNGSSFASTPQPG